MPRSVLVIYAGGTIGMRRSPEGYEPAPGLLPEMMRAMPELRGEGVPRFEVHEFARLLDSSNMTPSDWNAVGEVIAHNYEAHDGFVVLHGTDTMAYTASALSFMLEGLAKPVVLTGSQIPMCETRNDARGNLLTALMIAAADDLPEVCVCFGRVLLRGNRTVKTHAAGLDAFASPDLPPLADLGIEIAYHRDRIRAADPGPFRFRPCSTELVAAVRVFPGMTGRVLASVLRPPLRAVVLEAYGTGNAPTGRARVPGRPGRGHGRRHGRGRGHPVPLRCGRPRSLCRRFRPDRCGRRQRPRHDHRGSTVQAPLPARPERRPGMDSRRNGARPARGNDDLGTVIFAFASTL